MTPRRQPSLPQSLPCSPRPFFPPSVAMLYEVFWGDALQLSLLCGWKRSSLPPPSLTALFLLGRRRADGAEEGGARPSLRLRCKFTPSPALSPSRPPIALGDIRAYVRAPPPLRDREIDFVPPNDIKQAARSRSSARPRSGGVPPTRRPRSFQETEDDGRCPEGARARRPPSSPSLSLLIRRRRPLSPCGQTQSVGDGKGRLMRTRTRSHGWEGEKRTGG